VNEHGHGLYAVGQNAPQAVHEQRDTTTAGVKGVTDIELYMNKCGQEKCKISAKRGTGKPNICKTDPDLLMVVERWSSLPKSVHKAIIAMVETVD